MLFILLVTFLLLLLPFIRQLFFVFYDILWVLKMGYSLSDSFTSIHLFLGAACILWCWSWQWFHRLQVSYRFMYLIRWLSYFLEEQKTIYCISIFNWNRISCYDIYYQRDCLVTLVTCGYESLPFSSYSYVL